MALPAGLTRLEQSHMHNEGLEGQEQRPKRPIRIHGVQHPNLCRLWARDVK
eukprot:CAMPEP_0206509786 /NCGR_PEP_ID=MMETSP0324_2-20121206/59159_1 /ASSEMBLY_ACC=CAM_ASM_000836 /TAXON_ID=2866 /ORGANISM="Crypthecodinium cohnii, Strain Seligo" /LENGTH=50 /DNA_ID=CAMNT_0054000955 /DNA_START=237 /DNA_END=386 /DNA_ORIENTATION=-